MVALSIDRATRRNQRTRLRSALQPRVSRGLLKAKRASDLRFYRP